MRENESSWCGDEFFLWVTRIKFFHGVPLLFFLGCVHDTPHRTVDCGRDILNVAGTVGVRPAPGRCQAVNSGSSQSFVIVDKVS